MRTPVGLAIAAIVVAAAAYSFSPRQAQAVPAPTDVVKGMQVNSIARSSAGLVAGGELGQIIVSRDQGHSWQPAALSAQRQALITQITFANGLVGIATGHEGWILRTEDGGRNWHEQAFDQENGAPLMSAAKLPSGRWIAVGAFGRTLGSDDDGKTWQRFTLAGVDDKHLNRIAGSADGRHWLIGGERGLVLLSEDGGRNWTIAPAFYNGSFYGAVHLGASTWVVYGMRGNVFRSKDNGHTWARSAVPVPVSTLSHAVTVDGRLLLVGQGGVVLASTDDGGSFSVVPTGLRATLTDIALMPGGSWLLASDRGLKTVLPAAASGGSVPSPITGTRK